MSSHITVTFKKPEINLEHICSTMRKVFLAWALVRLIVSVLWTGHIIYVTATYQDVTELAVGIIFILMQLGEFVMISMFISAGIQKNGKLYHSYYRYCVNSLLLYMTAVIKTYLERFGLLWGKRYLFAYMYITFHFVDFNDNPCVFGVVAVFDICLKLFLVSSVKMLAEVYSKDKSTNKNVEST